MSRSGASSGGGGTSNYSYPSSNQSSNYNYLSFFATGSFGRRLEGQRSRDPNAPGNLEEEKKKWKWIAGAAIAFMFLTNIVAAIGLGVFNYQTVIDEAGFEGNLQEFIQHEMKNSLTSKCQPRYRKTQECSQISAQIILVADCDRDSVIWSKTKTNSNFNRFNRTTPGGFECSGIEVDLAQGGFAILSDGVYQIHSHASVHKMASGSKFQHEIQRKRIKWGDYSTVAEETLTRNCMKPTDPDEACFSSSLLATEHLSKKDVISVRFAIDGNEVKPTNKVDLLVHDGRSTFFGIVKLGVIK